MDLKSYIKALPDDQSRDGFSSQCGSTLGHLKNVMYGLRPCAPELATTIERASSGQVMRWDLRPEDWPRIWPELIGKEGAPAVDRAGADPSKEPTGEPAKAGA